MFAALDFVQIASADQKLALTPTKPLVRVLVDDPKKLKIFVPTKVLAETYSSFTSSKLKSFFTFHFFFNRSS